MPHPFGLRHVERRRQQLLLTPAFSRLCSAARRPGGRSHTRCLRRRRSWHPCPPGLCLHSRLGSRGAGRCSWRLPTRWRRLRRGRARRRPPRGLLGRRRRRRRPLGRSSRACPRRRLRRRRRRRLRRELFSGRRRRRRLLAHFPPLPRLLPWLLARLCSAGVRRPGRLRRGILASL